MQNIPEKETSHILPKMRKSTSIKIPVSNELLGRSSRTCPSKLISHNFHDTVSQNRGKPEVLENIFLTQTVDKDLQQRLLLKEMAQGPKDKSINQDSK